MQAKHFSCCHLWLHYSTGCNLQRRRIQFFCTLLPIDFCCKGGRIVLGQEQGCEYSSNFFNISMSIDSFTYFCIETWNSLSIFCFKTLLDLQLDTAALLESNRTEFWRNIQFQMFWQNNVLQRHFWSDDKTLFWTQHQRSFNAKYSQVEFCCKLEDNKEEIYNSEQPAASYLWP